MQHTNDGVKEIMAYSPDEIRHFTESPTSALYQSKSGRSLSPLDRPETTIKRCEFVGSISAVNDQLRREGLSRQSFIKPLVSEQTLATPDAVKRLSSDVDGVTPNKIVIEDAEDNAALVERYVFPGYSSQLLTPLPHHIDPVDQMVMVTKAQQSFKTKQRFLQYWNEIFPSHTSVSIFVDIFWWFFLNRYQPQKKIQDLMFARVSENYIVLLLKVEKKYSNNFFQAYPDVLSQCIYSTFIHAFPTSWNSFDEEFKTSICSLVYQWLLGLKPLPYIWSNWNFDELEPKNGLQHMAPKKDKKSIGSIKKFDLESLISNAQKEKQKVTPTKTVGRRGTNSTLPNIVDDKKNSKETHPPLRKTPSITRSSQVDKTLESLSLSIKGPEFEHAVMDITSHSPLVQYFMYHHKLQYQSGYTLLLQHTDMIPEYTRAATPTYGQVIKTSQGKSRETMEAFERAYKTLKEHMFRMEKERAEKRAHHRSDLKTLMRNSKEVRTLSNFLTVNQLCDQSDLRRKQKAMIVITDAIRRVS